MVLSMKIEIVTDAFCFHTSQYISWHTVGGFNKVCPMDASHSLPWLCTVYPSHQAGGHCGDFSSTH